MGLQRFERRLERIVEGAFGKAFRSGLQPVEVARRMLRELEAGRTLGVRGGTVVPNEYLIALSPADAERFSSYADALERELADEARGHARDEGYRFLGPVRVELVEDDKLREGGLDVEAHIVEAPGGLGGSLVVADGRRLPLDAPVVIGRLPECALVVDDPQASRRHAEIRRTEDGFLLHDLGSLNGTTLNGQPVQQAILADGDLIGVGETEIVFEAS